MKESARSWLAALGLFLVPVLMPVLVPVLGGTIGAGPASAEPRVSETIKYYDVGGRDAREVRANLNRFGPADKNQKRFDAITRWSVSWNYQYRQANGRCAIASVTSKVDVTVTFPRLKADASTPPALRNAFGNYTAKLMVHEKGHAQTGINIARRIETGIRALAPEPNCTVLAGVANRLGHTLDGQGSRADDEYDTRTQHGATQGATFP